MPRHSEHIGFVTALAMEARTLEHLPPALAGRATVRTAGPGPNAAREAAEALIAGGASMLVSWGFAGAIAMDLAPGDLIVGARSVDGDSGAWVPLAGLRGFGEHARVLASTAVVAGPARKRELECRYGAAAVDMETHAVARAGQAAHVPCLALRAIADVRSDDWIEAVNAILDQRGRPRPGALIDAMARRPGTLLAARSRSRAALARLIRLATELDGLIETAS